MSYISKTSLVVALFAICKLSACGKGFDTPTSNTQTDPKAMPSDSANTCRNSTPLTVGDLPKLSDTKWVGALYNDNKKTEDITATIGTHFMLAIESKEKNFGTNIPKDGPSMINLGDETVSLFDVSLCSDMEALKFVSQDDPKKVYLIKKK